VKLSGLINNNNSNSSSNNSNSSSINSSSSSSSISGDKSYIVSLERKCQDLEILVKEYMEKLSAYKFNAKGHEKKSEKAISPRPSYNNQHVLGHEKKSEKAISPRPSYNNQHVLEDVDAMKAKIESDIKSNSSAEISTSFTFDSVVSLLPPDKRKYLKNFMKELVNRNNENKDKTIKELSSELVRLEKEKKTLGALSSRVSSGAVENLLSVDNSKLSKETRIMANQLNKIQQMGKELNDNNKINNNYKNNKNNKNSNDNSSTWVKSMYLILFGSLVSIIASSFYQWRGRS
jgi:hypothetical protein